MEFKHLKNELITVKFEFLDFQTQKLGVLEKPLEALLDPT